MRYVGQDTVHTAADTSHSTQQQAPTLNMLQLGFPAHEKANTLMMVGRGGIGDVATI